MSAARALRMAAGFVLFQAAWFACVVSAARGDAALGIAAVIAVVLVLVGWSARRRADLHLVALAVAVGLVWDSALAHAGIVRYASPGPVPGWAPAWILALWALLAPMLRDPMRWLHGRRLLAALFGAIGGALSYAAAGRLGACTFPDFALAMIVLGAGWALILPLLLAAAQRVDRHPASRSAARPASEARA
ncbi:MAG TPA: DUF2878 domain-containing protein [Paraburkholderia sp.]|uniref:DUF2878 domain-containing protein n=1 Tax=Paraburkholderia sp. TaxID=1926495 RepID=UPI002CF9F9FD|nr:DUF2878 domain-containing protein [Paraburkholderia sp.]HTR11088.1 DUF2878 domain-containing protein [Paraburkholderia sp.]